MYSLLRNTNGIATFTASFPWSLAGFLLFNLWSFLLSIFSQSCYNTCIESENLFWHDKYTSEQFGHDKNFEFAYMQETLGECGQGPQLNWATEERARCTRTSDTHVTTGAVARSRPPLPPFPIAGPSFAISQWLTSCSPPSVDLHEQTSSLVLDNVSWL